MSRLIIFFGLFIVLQDSYTEEWYQGGKLHGSTLSQWSAASEKNKLATSSDWIVVTLGENEVRNMTLLKKKANILVNCIDTQISAMGKNYDQEKEKTNLIGLLCITELESNGWR